MKTKFPRYVLLGTLTVCFAATASRSAAQTTVLRGTISDVANAAIPKAYIELNCNSNGKTAQVGSAISQVNGSFELQALVEGACTVRISATGFKPLRKSIHISKERTAIDLGKLHLKFVGCSDPNIICDQVTAPVSKR
jgi:hypothetical protein